MSQRKRVSVRTVERSILKRIKEELMKESEDDMDVIQKAVGGISLDLKNYNNIFTATNEF